ncbi:unnamed protein product [Protopolystoma xenopodis]|uniref:Uncharacterized protein n=1 Tax=Protopolystoma xenopodis TaxID=117903 RepID=A0A448WJA7_9PLAT|nr:unnamed protein product [Protopolystoma xenopodis]
MSRSCNVFRYFGYFGITVLTGSLTFFDSYANISCSFTYLLLLTVAAFDEINSRAIQFVSLLMLLTVTNDGLVLIRTGESTSGCPPDSLSDFHEIRVEIGP